MGIFFNRPKNRKFDFIPRFYDPTKEDLKERMKKYDENDKANPEGMKHRIKSGLRARGRQVDSEFRSKQVRRSNWILLSVLVILIIISYIFLTEYLPQIIGVFDNSKSN